MAISLAPLDFVRRRRRRIVDELKAFVRFPTVSAQPARAEDLRRCATWLVEHLRRIGLERSLVVPTGGHPLVYAEWSRAPGRPTVLIYGHYDVQPADPLHEWRSPPFEPRIRGQDLHGRGASDDKGQMFAHIKALEAYLRTQGRLPVNVKCLFEGEEEIGSRNLTGFLTRNRRKLAADVAVISDMAMLGPDQPAITYSLRGSLAAELEVSGPKRDLHSGTFGGAVHNPLQALCEILAGLHDDRGRVTIPSFYARVRRVGESERAFMQRNGRSDEQILRAAQTERPWGERGYSLYERTTIRPVLTLNGITGGYQGPGGKAVIPSRATAKLSFRLVPDQDPMEVEALLRRHLARVTPKTVETRLVARLRAKPAVIDLRHPVIAAAASAYEAGFGTRPVFLRSGGSIPVVSAFQDVLGAPTALMGFGLPDDRIHAPNEKFHLPNLFKGIATCIAFLERIGEWKVQRGAGDARDVARAAPGTGRRSIAESAPMPA